LAACPPSPKSAADSSWRKQRSYTERQSSSIASTVVIHNVSAFSILVCHPCRLRDSMWKMQAYHWLAFWEWREQYPYQLYFIKSSHSLCMMPKPKAASIIPTSSGVRGHLPSSHNLRLDNCALLTQRWHTTPWYFASANCSALRTPKSHSEWAAMSYKQIQSLATSSIPNPNPVVHRQRSHQQMHSKLIKLQV
jgi:hypothetical protein